MTPKPKTIEEPKELQVIEPQNILDKPEQDTKFAHVSAKQLMDIVNKNNWAKKLGGDKPHLVYEAWQTVGKYYGYTVKTHDAEYVELGGTWGFKAKATVVNEVTGIIVGSAEALCMSDEYNWKSKPKFQLASMAQTRSGSKALRQILGFVVALAGYNPTPAEEMDAARASLPDRQVERAKLLPIDIDQKGDLMILLGKLGKTQLDLNALVKKQYGEDSYQKLSHAQADAVIKFLRNKLENVTIGTIESPDLTEEELDEIGSGIEQQRLE